MSSQTVVPKKKRGPSPTGKGLQVQVRLHDDILRPLEKFIADHGGELSKPDAIRRILAEYFSGRK
ncbi:hypothetical protein FS782_13740 [Agrobacterium vitis]|uniref:hypothetical protein n=1 Tax=Agrobacterium vitis TaxID=373 RepID=UPI001F3349EB|nr:hypothetical protein [Agrobacterium vitis]MCF1478133.1 hypothetical protein [Agrobacterium vitis]